MRSDSGGGTAWRCGGVLTCRDRIDARPALERRRTLICSIDVLWFRYHSCRKEEIARAPSYPLERRGFLPWFRVDHFGQIPIVFILLRLGFRFRIPEVEQAF